MKGVIVPFVGLPERTARENMTHFIEHARGLAYFNGAEAVRWDDDVWDLRSKVATRTDTRTLVLLFNVFESGGRTKRADRVLFPPTFGEEAKALVAATIPSGKMSAPYCRLMALRAVEKAFRELGRPADITHLDHAVLDLAGALLLRKTNENGNGRWVGDLARLAEEVSDKRLTAIPLSWKNPNPPDRNQRRSVRVQEDGSSAVSEKLSHIKCVLDLASVFQGAECGADVVTTAWFALAMFAPSRVSEILTLPLACQTEMDGVYGLSWRPSKGGAPLTKFATGNEWADVARTAIARLRKLGESARRAAAWYTEHPNRLYLPPGYEHLRGKGVTQHEVYAILGVGEGGFNNYALSRVLTPSLHTTHDLARSGGRGWTRLYEFKSLESYVIGQLPQGFPWVDRKFGLLAKDALFCLPRHTMRANYAIHANVPDIIDAGRIHKDLNDLASTIFVRHNLLDPETGQPWKLTSHQPRHLLNTLAQSKNVSQALIAFWSGRKRVNQNSWYDHVPHEAFIELFVALGEQAPREITAVGPLADKVAERSRREMVTPAEAMRLEVGSIISTRFGMCRHNYALTPCPKDKNCIGCGENTFIKGDTRHLAEAQAQLAIADRAIGNCLAAIVEDEPGVEPWLRRHREARNRWSMVMDRMLDPAIGEGTLITLPRPEVSQTKTGLSMSIREAGSHVDDLELMLAIGAEA